MMATVLDVRALNRALLARQLLLQRTETTAAAALEHLVGCQAQVPNDPYVALWSRIDAFDPHTLSRLVEKRKAVRLALHRGTLHLVTARDARAMRPLLQPAITRAFHTGTPFAKQLAGLDLDALVAEGHAILARGPLGSRALGVALGKRFPRHDPSAMAYAVHYLSPLVQLPPRGMWQASAAPVLQTAARFLGQPFSARPSASKIVLRYLRAFGPASLADLLAWAGSPELRATMDKLRPRLRRFTDVRGRELYDVPDGPLPDADSDSPPRFLPTYDNALLGHADRTRIVPEAYGGPRSVGVPTFLCDGFVRGAWKLHRDKTGATLTIRPFARLARAERAALGAEAERLCAFVAPDAKRRTVRFEK